MLRKLIVLLVCLCLCACLPDVEGQSSNKEPRIIHARLGPDDLYIPDVYVKFRHTSIGTESALLQAWYPGSAIVPGDSSIELSKQGVWWKNVRVLIDYYKNPATVDSLLNRRITHLKAFEVVGEEYGLIHQKQPKEYVQDNRDVWIENQNGKPVSFITCSEHLTETDVPQCQQYMQSSTELWLQISYDKRLLPEWKLIKANVEEMFESFQTEESAKVFIHDRIAEMDN